MKPPLALALAASGLGWAVTATAAERSVYVASFDKLRVQGPFAVRVATGQPPAATLSGDRAVIDAIEVQAEGSTLIIRNGIRKWGEQPKGAATSPVVVILSTPVLATASVVGAGKLTIGRMQAARIDLSVTGAGTIGVGEIAADAANVTVVGSGAITLAGKAGNVRLMTNGPGAIDADGLDAGDLLVRLDGPGATRARARYTASIVNTGLGQVAVAGRPKCTVKADAGGPVACGN